MGHDATEKNFPPSRINENRQIIDRSLLLFPSFFIGFGVFVSLMLTLIGFYPELSALGRLGFVLPVVFVPFLVGILAGYIAGKLLFKYGPPQGTGKLSILVFLSLILGAAVGAFVPIFLGMSSSAGMFGMAIGTTVLPILTTIIITKFLPLSKKDKTVLLKELPPCSIPVPPTSDSISSKPLELQPLIENEDKLGLLKSSPLDPHQGKSISNPLEDNSDLTPTFGVKALKEEGSSLPKAVPSTLSALSSPHTGKAIEEGTINLGDAAAPVRKCVIL